MKPITDADRRRAVERMRRFVDVYGHHLDLAGFLSALNGAAMRYDEIVSRIADLIDAQRVDVDGLRNLADDINFDGYQMLKGPGNQVTVKDLARYAATIRVAISDDNQESGADSGAARESPVADAGSGRENQESGMGADALSRDKSHVSPPGDSSENPDDSRINSDNLAKCEERLRWISLKVADACEKLGAKPARTDILCGAGKTGKLALLVDHLAEKQRDRMRRVNRHSREVEAACGRKTAEIKRLGRVVRELESENAELRRANEEMEGRLLPNGLSWPSYEDTGELLYFGDEVQDDTDDHEARVVDSVRIVSDTFYLVDRYGVEICRVVPSDGERVRRPVPISADGLPVLKGETVWNTCAEYPRELIVKRAGRYFTTCKTTDGSDVDGIVSTTILTHTRPMVAADGKVIHKGETVYVEMLDGSWESMTVEGFDVNDLVECLTSVDGCKFVTRCDNLTHEPRDSYKRLWLETGVHDEDECCGIDLDEFIARAKRLVLAGVE